LSLVHGQGPSGNGRELPGSCDRGNYFGGPHKFGFGRNGGIKGPRQSLGTGRALGPKGVPLGGSQKREENLTGAGFFPAGGTFFGAPPFWGVYLGTPKGGGENFWGGGLLGGREKPPKRGGEHQGLFWDPKGGGLYLGRGVLGIWPKRGAPQIFWGRLSREISPPGEFFPAAPKKGGAPLSKKFFSAGGGGILTNPFWGGAKENRGGKKGEKGPLGVFSQRGGPLLGGRVLNNIFPPRRGGGPHIFGPPFSHKKPGGEKAGEERKPPGWGKKAPPFGGGLRGGKHTAGSPGPLLWGAPGA